MLVTAYDKVQKAISSGTSSEEIKYLKDSLMNEVIYQLTPLEDKIGKDGKKGCLGLATKYATLYGHYHTIPLSKTLRWLLKPIKIDSKSMSKLAWFRELEKTDLNKFARLGSKQINLYEFLRKEEARVNAQKLLIKSIYRDLGSKAEHDSDIVCMQKNESIEIYFNVHGFRRFCSQKRWDDCENYVRNAFVY